MFSPAVCAISLGEKKEKSPHGTHTHTHQFIQNEWRSGKKTWNEPVQNLSAKYNRLHSGQMYFPYNNRLKLRWNICAPEKSTHTHISLRQRRAQTKPTTWCQCSQLPNDGTKHRIAAMPCRGHRDHTQEHEQKTKQNKIDCGEMCVCVAGSEWKRRKKWNRIPRKIRKGSGWAPFRGFGFNTPSQERCNNSCRMQCRKWWLQQLQQQQQHQRWRRRRCCQKWQQNEKTVLAPPHTNFATSNTTQQ